MAIASYKSFPSVHSDREENFHGARLFYLGWDRHLMFYAPMAFCLPPETTFRTFMDGVAAAHLGTHPEYAGIDWDQARWTRNGEPWHPRWDASLSDNQIAHKDLLRFSVPGLNGLFGAGF